MSTQSVRMGTARVRAGREGDPPVIQSIDRAAKILALLGGARRLGITEIANALGMPPPTVHGIVKSLHAHGLVAKEPGGVRYMLGPALLKLSSVYLDTLDVRSRSMHPMHAMTSRTGLAARLGVLHLGDVIVVHHEQSRAGGAQMPETGITIPSHASAMGKVLLAHDADATEQVIDGGLRPLTRDTIVDAAVLRRELADVRDEGIARENEEAIIGEVSAAVPVRDGAGAVVAALALVASSTEWPLGDAALAALQDTARGISRELGYAAW